MHPSTIRSSRWHSRSRTATCWYRGRVTSDRLTVTAAAASRYTEVRLFPYAEALLEDLDKDTVRFIPNYDESLKEPTVLPSKIPNLLVNGTDGIAVGMATKMPPHNLREVCAAVNLYLDNPEIPVEDIMKVMPGPDFPTGGVMMGTEGVRNIYTTGQGRVIVRGVATIEESEGGNRGDRIIVSELPYQVNKAQWITGNCRHGQG